ncbi:uncharacterized protein LOC125031331 [Penaeus chinensis]|uniref:uncharacterized protein LOC125031331 n=1 Tax=Penaeus chinensis TaxID=139456 RepID=UPI001FB58826|nr:uncharacterized protein LOC125031331 [Penaeus chinensis]
MTTITVSASGVAAAAAAGAAGLGLLGLGALAVGGRRRRGHRGSRGSRKKPSSGGYQRRRRSVEEALALQEEQEEAEALEAALEIIRERDVSGCGLLLVCDLARRDRSDLGPEEATVLDLIGPVIPGTGVFPPGAVGEYRHAKALGQAGVECPEAFPTCPFNGTQLLNTFLTYVP